MLNMSSKNVITPQFNNALSMPCQKGERILIVDDEPIIRDILERLVSCDGYHCETAQNGK
jgi:hypothetical protein